MCKNQNPSCATCPGKNPALLSPKALEAALGTLRTPEVATLLQQLPADVQNALQTLTAAVDASLTVTAALPVAPVVMRQLKTRTTSGPIDGEAVACRMMAICGCQGTYDCDCVSVENQARQELWGEHNQRQREQALA